MIQFNSIKSNCNTISAALNSKALNTEEDYDWYNFVNNDRVDDLMKIPEKELNDYMSKKINQDEKLKILFNVEIQEEIKDKEENKDGKDKPVNTMSDKKSQTQTVESKEKETVKEKTQKRKTLPNRKTC